MGQILCFTQAWMHWKKTSSAAIILKWEDKPELGYYPQILTDFYGIAAVVFVNLGTRATRLT